MKKLVFLMTFAACLIFVAGPAMAGGTPSAKFAATWTKVPGVVSVVDLSNVDADSLVYIDRNVGYTLATIKVPQDKELLIGLSAEIGLTTDTSIKGREGGAAKAIAGAKGMVVIFAEPVGGGDRVKAEPGKIMLSSRFQELTATLGGVLQSCIDTGEFTVDEAGVCTETCYDTDCEGAVMDCGEANAVSCPDGKVTIPCECIYTDEEIGLLLETLAAHHFNFVLPNMDQGVYEVRAYFTTVARANVDICDEGDPWCSYDPDGVVTASSYAKAFIGKTMLTVQQVRAAEGGLDEMEILEP